jgi:hypothetical protein
MDAKDARQKDDWWKAEALGIEQSDGEAPQCKLRGIFAPFPPFEIQQIHLFVCILQYYPKPITFNCASD